MHVAKGDTHLELAPRLLQDAQTFLSFSPKQTLCDRGTVFSCSFLLCAAAILLATGCYVVSYSILVLYILLQYPDFDLAGFVLLGL